MHKNTIIHRIAFFFTWAVAAVGFSRGATVTLTDGNSVTHFDTGSQLGQYDWTVDGVNQLAQQWFWYRIGGVAEHSVDTLQPGAVPVQSDPASFNVTYTGAQLQIKTTYTLTGGTLGSGTSDLAETIKITNITSGPLQVHFFQYVDFDLNNDPNGDTVQWTDPHAVLQTKGATRLAETVDTTNGASSFHREVNIFPNTLNSLNDGFPTTLSDNLGPLGPADVTWAFQWDYLSIPAGSSVIISKDKNLIVPEPATIGLLVMAGALMLRRRRAV
jgi:hypothetical protein